MKTITSHGFLWEVHSPSLYVHAHGEADILCGCNGRTWQLGINNAYRDRCFPSRDAAMAAYARGVEETRAMAASWHEAWEAPT